VAWESVAPLVWLAGWAVSESSDPFSALQESPLQKNEALLTPSQTGIQTNRRTRLDVT
jgi:hypothetical protein